MDGLTIQINEQSGTPNKKGAPRSRCKIHVHFLGYDNMRAWVTDDNVLPFKGKAEYDDIASKCPKNKLKDYFPTKKYVRLFDKGVEVAEDVSKLTVESRLKKLGLVYVPIENNDTNGEVISKSTKRKSTHKSGSEDRHKKSKLDSHSNSPVVPKIPSGGGFFKSFKPVPLTNAPNTNLNVFDFDENEEDAVQLELNKSEKETQEQKPSTHGKLKPNPKSKKLKKSTTTTNSSAKIRTKAKSLAKEAPLKKTIKSSVNTVSSKPEKNPSKKSVSQRKRQKKAPIERKSNSVPVRVVNHQNRDMVMKDLTSSCDGYDEFGQSDDDESTDKLLLGTLVWGRMSGFPFWPW